MVGIRGFRVECGGHFADAGKRLAKGVKWMFGVKSGL